jgi:hypothetical protein
MNTERDETTTWKKEYTIVLVLNFIYVLIFYYVMTSFN